MEEREHRMALAQVRRLVVKVGTSTLTYPTGRLNLDRMERLVRELADQANAGREVVLVTSGAIGAGKSRLGLMDRELTLPEKQAAAAVGQGLLMHMYEKFFADYGLLTAQVLLTREDLADRRRHINSRNTITTLLRLGVVPIVNENDTVAVEEIRVGDNDTLSALVAGLVEADLLIMLTDTEGLFTANPKKDPGARLVPFVPEITPEVEALAGGAGSSLGTGGMATKIQAAKFATSFGIPVVIASGLEPGKIARILRGEQEGTLFLAKPKQHMRKRWLVCGQVKGELRVDEGAKRAICFRGKSLLPSGIVAVEGRFQPGDIVGVLDLQGQEIARGISNYSAEAINKIKGRKTGEIVEILGYKEYDEVIHRDNMIVLI